MTHAKQTYRPYAVQEHLIRSKAVAETFRVKVMQPFGCADNAERFPVLYATDSDDFFGGYAAMANVLQLLGDVPRFILVGIGYENHRAAALLRRRDLYTRAIHSLSHDRTEKLAASHLVSGVEDVRTVTHSTDASDFLKFIRQELMPFITGRYATVPDDSSYFGYSAGGAFGLYTLFAQGDTFKRYMLGSPTTSYAGRRFGVEIVEEFIRSGRSLNAQVFMCVGELEEFGEGFGPSDLVSGYYALAKFLRDARIPGLDLTLRIFPGETHATTWVLAFNHGVKTLFGPAVSRPFWPESIK